LGRKCYQKAFTQTAIFGSPSLNWGAVVLEFKLGDILQLKKPHPCGSYDWEVIRVGSDIGIQCLKCHRKVLLERGVLEQRLKGIQNEKTKSV